MNREIPAIPRGFGDWGLAKPNRRRRVPGLEGAAVGVCLRCQVGRFGFASGSPTQGSNSSLPRAPVGD